MASNNHRASINPKDQRANPATILSKRVGRGVDSVMLRVKVAGIMTRPQGLGSGRFLPAC